jgi:hypothetical protein
MESIQSAGMLLRLPARGTRRRARLGAIDGVGYVTLRWFLPKRFWWRATCITGWFDSKSSRFRRNYLAMEVFLRTGACSSVNLGPNEPFLRFLSVVGL